MANSRKWSPILELGEFSYTCDNGHVIDNIIRWGEGETDGTVKELHSNFACITVQAPSPIASVQSSLTN